MLVNKNILLIVCVQTPMRDIFKIQLAINLVRENLSNIELATVPTRTFFF